MVWYQKVGFYSNPFSIKPAAFHNEVFGYDIDNILEMIRAGNLVFIEGNYGKGKTTILKAIIRRFGGHKKLVYYSCNRTEDGLDIERLLKKRYGFLGRLFNLKPDDVILLLDEVQGLNREDSEKLIEYYPKNLKSIILVSAEDYPRLDLSNSLKSLIDKNIIKLKKISEADAINLIRKRIGDLPLLSNDIIKLIFKKSGDNPRALLKNCEKICKYVIDKGDAVVIEKDVKKVLG